MLMEGEKTYLGLDFSTQQLKGIIVGEDLNVLLEESVEFDSVLPEFRTHKGVIHSKDGRTITTPTIMWVKAMDVLLDKLQVAGADFGKIAAVSGSAQQHGTVYWQKGSENVLRNLDPTSFLHTQLASSFTIPDSPVWMDSSTSTYCRKLEEAVGGPEELAKLTGAVAFERFSGPQISKIAETKKIAYENTERISLISSFGCSLLLGRYAPIDLSDGSGMNLLDLQTKDWNSTCLTACAPNLADKLGKPVPCGADLGVINEYFVERFAFNANCRVASFTGDNPASLIGMRLKAGDVAISLGTSDTVFLWLDKQTVLPECHVSVNPLKSDAFMGLLCFKNGSLTRERFRDTFANRSWDEFNSILERTPRGNFGNVGYFFDVQEILPWAQGEYRFDKADNVISKFPSIEIELRALIEGQFIAKRSHAEDLGVAIGPNSKILATGGASKNKVILQILSDVFNRPVYVLEGANSSVLGASYLAKYALRNDSEEPDPVAYFDRITSNVNAATLVCTPYGDADQIYTPMVTRYKRFISDVLNKT
ncbi:xylulose kinase [Planococcus citri]|uniref:xylulose kinase n=1 Tax=Planococcus citri TaxID=170843 RepID=UPI0031FA0874